MAWTEKRPGGHIGRYRDANGRTKNTPCLKSKRAAMEAAERQEQLVKSADWVDPKEARITLGEWSTEWFKGLNVTPKTRECYQERYTSLIEPRWGDVRLDQIALPDVMQWVATMVGARGKPASETRKKDASAQLLRMLDAAMDAGRIRKNPARTRSGKADYVPRAKRAKEHRYLTAEELHKLASACGRIGETMDETFVLLTGYTGLRWGEITALRVRDFALLKRRLTVAQAYSTVSGKVILGEPKDHERRTVPFPSFLQERLGALMEGKGRDDLVFTSRRGTPLNNRNWPQRILERAWPVVGIDRLTFHDLRHTAASLAVAAGANVKGVQAMLGHASAALTLDTYAGLFDGHLDDVAERMNARALEAIDDASAHWVPTGSGGQVVGLPPVSQESGSDLR